MLYKNDRPFTSLILAVMVIVMCALPVNAATIKFGEPPQNLVMAITWREDGQYLAVGMGNNVLILDDKYALVSLLEGHTDFVTDLAWRSDDEYIVSASADESLIVWDISTSEPQMVFTQHTQPVTSVAWERACGTIVSGDFIGNLYLWKPFTGDMGEELLGMHQPAAVEELIFTSDNTSCVVMGLNNSHFVMWRYSGWNVPYLTLPPIDLVEHWGMSLNPNEDVVAIAGINGIQFIDINTYRISHIEAVGYRSVAWSSNGMNLWVMGGTLDVFDANTGDLLEEINVPSPNNDYFGFGNLKPFSISPDDRYILTPGESRTGEIMVWDATTYELLQTINLPALLGESNSDNQ